MESYSSFLEVSETPIADPQNLSPASLQCYCKFKKQPIELTPIDSTFNNKPNAFLEENVQVDRKNLPSRREDNELSASEEARPVLRGVEAASKFEDSSVNNMFNS